jgi:hypothetical protein
LLQAFEGVDNFPARLEVAVFHSVAYGASTNVLDGSCQTKVFCISPSNLGTIAYLLFQLNWRSQR